MIVVSWWWGIIIIVVYTISINTIIMTDNHDERVVDHYEQNGVIIDTCAVSDSEKDYETGVVHPGYNDGARVIVELYDTKGEAVKGHTKWVLKMTADILPGCLTDVSSCGIAMLCDVVDREPWREYRKED